MAIQKFWIGARSGKWFFFKPGAYWIVSSQQRATKEYEYSQKTIEALAGLSGKESEANHGHYADRELAYAYLNAINTTLH